MSWSDTVTIGAYIIASLGGGGAIVLWFGNLLATRYVEGLKHEIQQEIESYRTKLKKSEFLFQKEFEAASQFMSLRRDLEPRYRFPDMDWHDACRGFASAFDKVEEGLEKFVAIHGAALTQEVLDDLSSAIAQAAHGRVGVDYNTENSEAAIAVADRILEKLGTVEEKLRNAVWSQSST